VARETSLLPINVQNQSLPLPALLLTPFPIPSLSGCSCWNACLRRPVFDLGSFRQLPPRNHFSVNAVRFRAPGLDTLDHCGAAFLAVGARLPARVCPRTRSAGAAREECSPLATLSQAFSNCLSHISVFYLLFTGSPSPLFCSKRERSTAGNECSRKLCEFSSSPGLAADPRFSTKRPHVSTRGTAAAADFERLQGAPGHGRFRGLVASGVPAGRQRRRRGIAFPRGSALTRGVVHRGPVPQAGMPVSAPPWLSRPPPRATTSLPPRPTVPGYDRSAGLLYSPGPSLLPSLL